MKSLRSRLIVTFSVMILILFTIVIIISVSLSSNSLSNMAETNLNATLSSDLYAIKRIVKDDYGQLRYENNHLLKANGEPLEGDYGLIDELGDSLHVVVTIFEKDGNDFRRVTTNIVKDNGERAVNTYLGVDSGAFEDVSNGVTYEGEADILGKTYLTVYEPIMQDGAVVGITFVGVEETEAAAIINESMSALLQWMIIVAVLMMLFAIAVTTFISNMITKPIKSVVNNTNQLASYDLTTVVDNKWIERKDEIGVLAKATDALITNLRELVSEVAQNSEQVAATAEELTATSQQSATSSEEVAETIQEIANGATEQAENASVGSDKLAELSRLVEADRQHIELMEQSTDNVSQLVNDGLGISDQLANKTKQNNEASGYVYDSILKTNTSSEKIGEASNVIAAIAQQTNLLALNAAIEAARAGEAGKGFSVVADEIRKLAEQSTASTQRIDEMVSTLKEDAGLAVSKMKEAAEIVKEQEESVAKTIDKYNEIAKAMATSEKVVEELTTSAQLMEARKEDVQASIESLSAVAEENAASTEEASAAIEEQTASIEEIANASEGLSRLSIELQQLIEKFKL